MHAKRRKVHPYHPHAKAERALTMAVLMALLSGAAAMPAMAKDVRIEEGETVEAEDAFDHKAYLRYDANAKETDENKTNSPSGNTLTILGKVMNKAGSLYVTAAYSGGQMSSLITVYSSKAARLRMGRSTAATP